MSEAQIEAYIVADFGITDDTVLGMLRALGDKGGRNDELWDIWRNGKTLTEVEIHAFQNQIVGRTSELLRLGKLIATKEAYVRTTGEGKTKTTSRSRFYIPAQPLPPRKTKVQILEEQVAELQEQLKELTIKYAIACTTIDRLTASKVD